MKLLIILLLSIIVVMLFTSVPTKEGFTAEELQDKQADLQEAIDAAKIEYKENKDYYNKVAAAVQNVTDLQNEYSTDADIQNDLAIQKLLKEFNTWKSENIIQDRAPVARPTLAPTKSPSILSKDIM